MPKPTFASPRQRIIAFVIDTFLVFVVFAGLAAFSLNGNLSQWWIFGALYFVYHLALLNWRQGITSGREAQGLRIISANGSPALMPIQCLVRSMIRALPLAVVQMTPDGILIPLTMAPLVVLLMTDLFMMVSDPARRTLTDRLAGTWVVNLPPREPKLNAQASRALARIRIPSGYAPPPAPAPTPAGLPPSGIPPRR